MVSGTFQGQMSSEPAVQADTEVQEEEQEQVVNQEEESDSSSMSTSDPGVTALGEYCPFIADVPISSYAEPFPIVNPDTRSEQEIEQVKKGLRKTIHQKKFDPPLPLADFCLIAKERWDQDESDSEGSMGLCLLL